MKDFVEFLHQVGKLKDTIRAGWLLRKVPNPESVADHTFRIALMALTLADKFGVDKNKCVNMALIHDLGESIIGDITPHDNVTSEQKHKIEKEAMVKLLGNINSEEILELWEEYEKGETLEAKFVGNLDKIEMLVQAFEYEQKYVDEDINLEEFFEYVDEKVVDSKMREIIDILKEKRNGR